MNNVIRILISVIITMALSPCVKSFALSHHTQWNLSVVILLLATIYLLQIAAREFRQVMTIGKDDE